MRILWLKTELLHPVDKGGKIRTYHMLKELKRNHHVTYLTLDEGSAAPDARELAAEYCHELVCVPHWTRRKFSPGFYAELAGNLISPLPYFLGKYESPAMREAIAGRAATGNYDVVVCDFLMPAINLPQGLHCATVLFQHNVEAMIWKRHYEVQNHWLKRVYLRGQWRKTIEYEKSACRRFDSVIAVSKQDAQIMREAYGLKNVTDVPTGVDTVFFRPDRGAEHKPFNIVFTGSMDWLPNEDAMQYFTSGIFPLIRQQAPETTLTIVGRNPYRSLIELSKRDPAISVTGRVDDVRPYMEAAALYVVPIRIGGGTRLKIYEAMAMEKPIVSTSIGAEGLDVRNGAELILADTTEAFASEIIRLFKHPEEAIALGMRAAGAVRQKFGWESVSRRFAAICEAAVRYRTRYEIHSNLPR